ncbi:ROK family protein [Thalassoporum mexicanum PCC 7367]|uniref:ROK family protein n=1 Tax=Thalassoporum mexicanum TaxID=3457544 RepID=UPI00029FC719|nr:ROK family protein [Pseudanabaena sp. PCC 7367]AFY70619.1 ROK family protein [Pseudanabaena sp. PCC 7367]
MTEEKLTLAIDVGGSGIKAMVLLPDGTPKTERVRLETPQPSTTDAVVATIIKLAEMQGEFDRVSVGFPSVVRNGVTQKANNLGDTWHDFDLAKVLQTEFKRPVRVANDADIQGLGAIAGTGTELVITLGTGFGSALFIDGRLVPNLELCNHYFMHGKNKEKSYEDALGDQALEKIGKKDWNKRLAKAIDSLEALFNYDYLYIGGGNSKHIKFELPSNVKIIPNITGILGGIALWRDV